jgi:hypothetical protein
MVVLSKPAAPSRSRSQSFRLLGPNLQGDKYPKDRLSDEERNKDRNHVAPPPTTTRSPLMIGSAP